MMQKRKVLSDFRTRLVFVRVNIGSTYMQATCKKYLRTQSSRKVPTQLKQRNKSAGKKQEERQRLNRKIGTLKYV